MVVVNSEDRFLIDKDEKKYEEKKENQLLKIALS